jgi:hypothetical protein
MSLPSMTARLCRTSRSFVIAICVGAVSVLVVPSGAVPATAAEPTLVNVTACHYLDDGMATVPAGADIRVRLLGFEEGNYGLIRELLGAAKATLTITTSAGVQVIDETSALVVSPIGPRDYIARPANYDLGVLAAGGVVTVTYSLTLRHPLAVVYPPVGPTGDNGPFLTEQEDPTTCEITAI